MARVSLVQEADRPDLSELIARIRGGRGGRLLNLYRALLHSPPLAEAWLAFNSAVRWHTELDGQTREIVIIRIGLVNQAAYVVRAHVPRYAAEAGLSLAQCEALADWERSPLFSPPQRAALAYADVVTANADVPGAVFAELKRHYSERQIVELTVLIGMYNLHTRVVRALQIDPEPSD